MRTASALDIDAEDRSAAGAAPAPTDFHGRPLQFLQVAFAGHNRPEDLGDPAQALSGLRAAFTTLASAGLGEARLVTGLAAGADLLAAEAWGELELGPIHAVFPFLDFDADPQAEALATSTTWLDGVQTVLHGRNPHLAQTRWLIGAADLLVVFWTGEHARGAGGTADAVRLALEHGIPVLWVQPGPLPALRLINPQHLDEDFGFLEFLEELQRGREPLVQAADAATLHRLLVRLGFATHRAEGTRPEDAAWRKIAADPPARAYAAFRRLLGGRPPHYETQDPPEDLAGQVGFKRLSQALAEADVIASRLGALHRSHQLILLLVAISAAVIGSTPGLFPQAELFAVTAEFMLAIFALLLWLEAERGVRNERWGHARRLAEDLRLERVAWTLGLNTSPHDPRSSSDEAAVRERRWAGLPAGRFDAERVQAWGRWAIEELIVGQARYHRGQSQINSRVAHRVHQVENTSFSLLLILLTGYILFELGAHPFGLEVPHWLTGGVTVAGAVVPAIGAAGLALEATLSLGEQAQRSRVLAEQLDHLGRQFGDALSLETLQAKARVAIRLQRAQEAHWNAGAGRRRLFRGG